VSQRTGGRPGGGGAGLLHQTGGRAEPCAQPCRCRWRTHRLHTQPAPTPCPPCPTPGPLWSAALPGTPSHAAAHPCPSRCCSYGTPLRVAEMNTISNSGRMGVSNVFSSALWTLDSALEVAGTGAVGVNFHQVGDYCWHCTLSSLSGACVLHLPPLAPPTPERPDWKGSHCQGCRLLPTTRVSSLLPPCRAAGRTCTRQCSAPRLTATPSCVRRTMACWRCSWPWGAAAAWWAGRCAASHQCGGQGGNVYGGNRRESLHAQAFAWPGHRCHLHISTRGHHQRVTHRP